MFTELILSLSFFPFFVYLIPQFDDVSYVLKRATSLVGC